MVAKARIAEESTTGAHLRGEQEDLVFDQDAELSTPLQHHVLYHRNTERFITKIT